MANINDPIPLPQDVPLLELSNEAVEQEQAALELSRKQWEESVLKRDQKTFSEYQEFRKTQGNPLNYKNLDTFKSLVKEEEDYEMQNRTVGGAGLFAAPPRRIDEETGDFIELDLHRKEFRKYKKYKDEKEKLRFDALPDALKDIEIANGGVYNESLGLRAFSDSFLNGLTLGISSKEHPVYGESHIARNPGAATTGDIMGQTLSFMAMNLASGGLGLPSGIMNLARGSEGVRKIVVGAGYVPYQMSRYSNSIKAISRFSNTLKTQTQLTAATELGAQSVANAMIFSIGDSTRELVNKYRYEDNLGKGEWANNLKVPVKNFLEGLTFSFINSPQSWGARFVADTMYETALQGYHIATNQQENWDLSQFAINFFVGNIMGEGQSKIFSRMSPENKAALLRDRDRNDFYSRVVDHPDFKKLGLEDGEAVKMASILSMWDEVKQQSAGVRSNNRSKNEMVDMLYKPYNDIDVLHEQMKYGDLHKITVQDLMQEYDQAGKQAIDVLGDYFSWDATTKDMAIKQNILVDKRAFNKLIKKDLVSKESEGKQIDGISSKSLLDGLYSTQADYARKLELGEISKAQMKFLDAALRVDIDNVILGKTMSDTMARSKDHQRLNKEKFTDDELSIGEEIKSNIENFIMFRTEASQGRFEKITGREMTTDDRADIASYAFDQNVEFYAGLVKSGITDPEVAANEILIRYAKRVKSGLGTNEDLSSSTFGREERFDNQGDGSRRKDYSGDPIRDTSGKPMENLNRDREILAGNPSTPGSDSQSVLMRQREYARILELSQESPELMLGAIFRYISNRKKISNPTEIKELLREFNITGINEKEIKRLMNKATKRMPKMDSKIKKRSPVKSDTYTREEINTIYEHAKRIREGVNPITGIRPDVGNPSMTKAAKRDGVYTVSVRRAYDTWLKKYGKTGADRILNKISDVIKNQISRRSNDYRSKDDDSKLILRNPVENESTDFMVFSEGLSKTEFNQVAHDLVNVLTGAYGGKAAVEADRFSIHIDKFNKIREIPVDVSFVRDVGVTAQMSKHVDSIKKISRRLLNDEANQGIEDKIIRIESKQELDDYARLNELLNLNDDFSINAVLEGARASEVAEIVARLVDAGEHIPSSFPSIRQADVYAAENKVIKDDDKYLEHRRSRIKSRLKDEYVETILLKASKVIGIDEQDLGAGFIDANFKSQESQKKLLQNMQRAAEDAKEEELGLVGGIAKSLGDLGRSGLDFFRTRLAVSTGVTQEMQRSVYNIQGKREHITKIQTPEMMETVYGDFIAKHFSMEGLNSKQRKEAFRRWDVFNRLQTFAYEQEFKKLFDDTSNYKSLKEDVMAELRKNPNGEEYINWSTDKKFDVDTLLEDPNSISGMFFDNYRQGTVDDFAFMKMIIKNTGVSADDLVNFLIYKDKTYYKPLAQTHMNHQRDVLGSYKNADLFEEVQMRYRDDIVAELRKTSSFDFANTIDFSSESDLKKLVGIAKQIGGLFEIKVKQLINMQPENLSYVSHRVISDPDNQRIFKGEINDFLAGKDVSGSGTLSPIMTELSGRKIATTLDLIERGYKVELNTYEVEFANLAYVYTKKFNANLAESLKTTFINRMDSAYSRIDFLEREFNNEKNKEGVPDRIKYDKLNAIIDKKDQAIKTFMTFFDDTGGFFYRPSKSEIARATSQKKKLDEQLEIERGKDVRNQDEINKINSMIGGLEDKIDKMKGMVDILSAERLVKEKNEMLKIFSKTKDESIKLTPESKNRRKTDIEQERKGLSSSMAQRLTAEETYLPMNKKSHIQEEANSETKTKNFTLFNHIKIKDAGEEAANLPLFDGLYINLPSSRMFKQYIFRDDWGDKQSHHEFKKKIIDGYDKTNRFLKVITLVKPTILMANDSIQGMLALPMQKWVFKNLGFARQAFVNRHARWADKGEIDKVNAGTDFAVTPREFYKLMNDNDLFNHGVSYGGVVKDSTRVFTEMAGADDFLGINATVREIQQKIDPSIDGKTADIRAKKWLKNQWVKASDSFTKYQEVAWNLDEWIRLQVSKGMYDRFARAKKSDGTPMYDKQKAAFLAAEWTNLHLVQYSQVPSATRRMFNRFFMFPTFRIGTARMYKNMFTNFGKGVGRIFGANPDAKFKVSENKWEQALFEMGPMLRSVALKTAIKGLVASIFGYTFSDPWTKITGYRGQKVVNPNDPMNKTLAYMSMGTPIFELEKYITRPLQTTLLFNSPGVYRVLHTIFTNRNVITGKPIVTPDAIGDTTRVSSQIAGYLFQSYFPLGSDISNWMDSDIGFAKQVLNTSGFAFFYDADSPTKLTNDFNAMLDRAKTPQDHQIAVDTFNSGMRRAWKVLFNEEYKDIVELMEEANSEIKR